MAMAQEGTIDRPSARLQPSPQHAQCPDQYQPSKTGNRERDIVSQNCGEIGSHFQENTGVDDANNLDDEVQFVFSVPRRRRKKRKRPVSSCRSSSILRDSKGSASPASNSTAPYQTVRRGSTGMVQQLESCHIGGRMHTPAKSESLPTITPNLTSHLVNPQSVSILPPDIQSAPSLSVKETVPWWDMQVPKFLGNGSFQFDICGMPFAEEILKKRKYEGEPEEAMQRSTQSSQNTRPSAQVSDVSGLSMPGPNSVNNFSVACAGSYYQDSVSEALAPTTPRLDCLLGSPNNHIRPHSPATTPCTINESWHRVSQEKNPQGPSLVRSLHNGSFQQQAIHVPVSLVPELSVSPRTKTVQVLKPLNPNQLQSQKMLSQTVAIPRSVPLPAAPQQSTQGVNTQSMDLNRQTIGTSNPEQVTDRFPPSQSNANDVLRKPSLYNIPPWPSPPTSPHLPDFVSDKQGPLFNMGNQTLKDLGSPLPSQPVSQKIFQQALPDTSHIRRPPSIKTQAISHNPTAIISMSSIKAKGQEPANPAPCAAQFLTAPSKHLPISNATPCTSSSHAQTNQSKRKYSPNLIVDIAETCQENFPFAAVADRHKQPIQKVFDTFSAIIQLPLLRSAADNRRHGDLGKRRLKEFRDAKKAMEKAQEQERKNVLREAGKAEMGDLAVHRRPKKAPVLLKAAILNNARGKDGDLEL